VEALIKVICNLEHELLQLRAAQDYEECQAITPNQKRKDGIDYRLSAEMQMRQFAILD
jgi:hypothetical protein